MDNTESLRQADAAVGAYAIVTEWVPGFGYKAVVTQYPNIFALGETKGDADAQARECLKQHLAANLQRGMRPLPAAK